VKKSLYRRYVPLESHGISAQQWDACIKRGDDKYSDETVRVMYREYIDLLA